MNRKTLYLNLVAATLMTAAGTANAGRPMPLADAVRMQMREASANIEADMRATVKNQTRRLDIEGVKVGPIELVDEEATAGTPPAAESGPLADLLREELALKALEVPGMFGVYRYMSYTALGVALIVAE